MLDKDEKEGFFKRLENILDTNFTQLQAIGDQGEKRLKRLKNIEESRTLEATDKIRRKMMKQKTLCLKLRK